MKSHLKDLRQAALGALADGGSGIALMRLKRTEIRAEAAPSPTGGAPIVRWYRGETRITKAAAGHLARTAEGPRHPVRLFGLADHWSAGKLWRKICVAGGLEVIMPHAAGRHGFGTEAIVRAQVDPVSAAKEGGWASPTVMLETYSHPITSSDEIQAALRAGRSPGSGNDAADAE